MAPKLQRRAPKRSKKARFDDWFAPDDTGRRDVSTVLRNAANRIEACGLHPGMLNPTDNADGKGGFTVHGAIMAQACSWEAKLEAVSRIKALHGFTYEMSRGKTAADVGRELRSLADEA